jgi:hypothetical protein
MKRLLSVWLGWLRKSHDRRSHDAGEPRYGWSGTPIAQPLFRSPSDPLFDSLSISQVQSAEGMSE